MHSIFLTSWANRPIPPLVLIFLSLFLVQASSHARPTIGRKTPPTSTGFDRTTRLFHPDAYANIPEGRSGSRIGLAIIPRLHRGSDGGEKAVAELIGHIPAVSMAITLPPNDPLYLFKFLKHLKSKGKKVDFLIMAGHALQDNNSDDVFAINLGADRLTQWLRPAVLDVVAFEKEISQLEASGQDPVRKKDLCEKVDLIYEGSSAVMPGTQLILHSCYAGHSDQTAMMRTFATAFLGVNGGSSIAPKYATESKILGNIDDPNGFGDTLSAMIVTRSLQIGKILRARRYVRPGDAFLETQFYTELSVPANTIKVPACCGKDKETWRKLVGLWLTDTGARVRVTCSASNELSGLYEADNSNYAISPGAPFFTKGFAKSSNTVHSDNSYSYAKKGDKIPPHGACPMEITISADGKKVTGKKTRYQYYDGSTTWDAGTNEGSVNWTRIGN